MNRIIAAVQAKSNNYKMRLAGCVANRSKETNEVDRYCNAVGFNRIAHMPDVDVIRRSRLKKKTLFRNGHGRRCCHRSGRIHQTGGNPLEWNRTFGSGPAKDRDIFELLGFD